MKIVATRKDEQNRAAVDPWTLVHFSTGLALGLMDFRLLEALGASAGYEIVEQFVERKEWGQEFFHTRRPESLPNALVDLAVFAVGFWAGSLWNRTG